MAEAMERTLPGTRGEPVFRIRPHPRPRATALLVHGYGEHLGRYGHVADARPAMGAAVYGPGPMGHGKQAGTRRASRPAGGADRPLDGRVSSPRATPSGTGRS